MKEKRGFIPEDFRRCVDFHGHICPGLAIGYRAAKAGMEWLAAKRAEDEEVVAIVETDACGADAIQVLTGCTFGKGNFFHRDYRQAGLHPAGAADRPGGSPRFAGRGFGIIRAAPGSFSIGFGRVRPPPKKEGEFQQLHRGEIPGNIGKASPRSLFAMKEVSPAVPPKAKIEPSKPCQICGEPTMGSKIQNHDGKEVCRSCCPG